MAATDDWTDLVTPAARAVIDRNTELFRLARQAFSRDEHERVNDLMAEVARNYDAAESDGLFDPLTATTLRYQWLFEFIEQSLLSLPLRERRILLLDREKFTRFLPLWRRFELFFGANVTVCGWTA